MEGLKVGDYVFCEPSNMLTKMGTAPKFDGRIVAVHSASYSVKCYAGGKKLIVLELRKSDVFKAMKTPYHYGTAIMHRRKDLSITQEQLAQQTGISPRTIINIESGSPSVSIGTINRIREALGMTELE